MNPCVPCGSDFSELLFPVVAVNHALDSVAKAGHVEIDQQADWDSAQPHVGQELRLMDRMDCFDGLYFDNDRVLDDQVHAISEFYFFAFVDDW